MSKKLDTSGVVNELRGNSAFFPARHAEAVAPAIEPVALATATPAQTTPTANERPNEPSVQRRKVRHTFDIFGDQLLSLKEIAIERQRISGNRVLLGDLVQEALDRFITRERNPQRTVARTTEGSNQATNEPSFERATERTIVRTDTTDEQYP